MYKLSFYKLTYLTFLVILFPSLIGAKTDIIYYRHPLALTLLKYGTNHFLYSCRDIPAQEYKGALEDVIDLASNNSTDVPLLLRNLKDILRHRIKRIERLKKEEIDWENISSGAAYIAASGVASGSFYYVYKKFYAHYNDDSTKDLFSLYFCGGFPVAYLLWLGSTDIYHGLYPYRDDQYLEQYINFLRITNELTRKYNLQQNSEKGNKPTC